jgi:N-acetylglucosaminyl-diphospho-decaprenol L-rhamnosyltransferase
MLTPGDDLHPAHCTEAVDVTTVIVVHNNADLLPTCLASLATAAQSATARVVVVDAGSSDQPAAICDRAGVPCLRRVNRGLGASFNSALERDEVRRARYVLQLNPDVVLPTGALDTLVQLADRHRDWGVLAPRQFDQNGRLIFSIGVEPTARAYWAAIMGLPGDWIWDSNCYRAEYAADWMMGACLLLRREMLAAIGGFDERFFLCSEEVDLCHRARAAGWSVIYTPEVTVMHPIADRPIHAHRVRLEEWSRILYLRKWNGWLSRTSTRVALVTRLILLAAAERARLISPRHARVRLGAALRLDRRRYGPALHSPERPA